MQDTPSQRGEPKVIQFSVFLENRVGKLREFLRVFDSTDVQVAALSVLDSADCAIVRCVLTPCDEGRSAMQDAKLAFCETELVVAELGSPDVLGDICSALVAAELNIHYAYSLIVKPHGASAVALHVDDPILAATVLNRAGFTLLSEKDML